MKFYDASCDPACYSCGGQGGSCPRRLAAAAAAAADRRAGPGGSARPKNAACVASKKEAGVIKPRCLVRVLGQLQSHDRTPRSWFLEAFM